MPRVVPACLALLLVACAAPPRFDRDGWSIERRFGAAPALVSTSEVNAGSTPAAIPLDGVPVRARSRGQRRVAISAEPALAARWTAGAALLDPHLDHALDWLERLGAGEDRAIELRLTLVADSGARRHVARHPATETLVVDLLVPVPAAPPSRSASLETALATGLHEASHALRPAGPGEPRNADEVRASLVAACFRIEALQPGDRLTFADASPPHRDFTRSGSAGAAREANQLLRQALGGNALAGSDGPGKARLAALCRQRLG
jgi:hypothetical protein